MPTDPTPSPPPSTGWTVRRYRLGEEPPERAAAPRTAEACVELVATLSERFWELTGRPRPSLPRSAWPIARTRRP